MLETALLCLALNVYHESRGEGVAGQVAVAHVTMNRVKNKRYPNTVCGVVTQRKQFSWTNTMLRPVVVKGKLVGYQLKPAFHPKDDKAWQRAVRVAKTVMSGKSVDITNGALFYHERKISPKWREPKMLAAQVGNHVFYLRDKSVVNYNKSIKGV